MKLIVVIAAVLLVSACGKEENNVAPGVDAGPTPDSGAMSDASSSPDASGGEDAASTPDDAGVTADGGPAGDDMGSGGADQGNSSDCDEVCAGETPFCSGLVGRCVECLSNNDCSTAPEFTCETLGDGAGGDPSFECVECVSDAQCNGATCDPDTNTCVL